MELQGGTLIEKMFEDELRYQCLWRLDCLVTHGELMVLRAGSCKTCECEVICEVRCDVGQTKYEVGNMSTHGRHMIQSPRRKGSKAEPQLIDIPCTSTMGDLDV